MAYRFPLAAVLRLREINEQREERLLGQIHAQIKQWRATLASLQSELARTQSECESALRGGISAAHLQDAQAMQRSIEERQKFAEGQIVQFTQLRDKQIEVYRSAHQAREVLSTMERDQKAAFSAALARQSQKVLDDTFLARRARR